MTMEKPAVRGRAAMIGGLVIALAGTVLFWWPSVAGRLFPQDLVLRNLAAQGVDWMFALALVGIVLLFERRSLASLRFTRPNVKTIAAGLGLGGFMMIGIVGWKFAERALFPEVAELDIGAPPSAFPPGFFLWFAPIALITASVCEEVIWRGYAMERLLLVTKSPVLAIILSQISFALYHVKDGWSTALMVLTVGSLFPIFFLTTRSLTVTIIGHAMVDGLALVGSMASPPR